MTSRTGNSARGVTLLELIIVLGILTAVAAVAAPRLTTFTAGRALQSEGARFLAVTRYARSEAVSRGSRAEVWIQPADRRYGVNLQDATGEQDPAISRSYTLASGLRFQLDGSMADPERAATVAYRPDGTLEPEAIERFWMMREDGDGIQIALDTSRARYELLGVNEQPEWETNENAR